MPDPRLQPSPGAAVTTLTRQLAPHLAEGELVLGSVHPVARHAWTAVGITGTDSRWVRAMQMLVLAAGSVVLLLAGLAMATVAALLAQTGGKAAVAGALLFVLPALAALAIGTFGVTRPWLLVRATRDSQCVLTSHAGLLIENISQGTPQVRRFELTSLQPVSACRIRADGVGDIVLTTKPETGHAATPDRGFFAVPDARQLAVQIEATRRVRSRRAEREIITAMQDDYQGYLRRSGQL